MKRTLPVGSVIKLKNKKEEYFIIGKNIMYEGKKYDYMCLIYPQGFLCDINNAIYINEDDNIEFMCHLGNINY